MKLFFLTLAFQTLTSQNIEAAQPTLWRLRLGIKFQHACQRVCKYQIGILGAVCVFFWVNSSAEFVYSEPNVPPFDGTDDYVKNYGEIQLTIGDYERDRSPFDTWYKQTTSTTKLRPDYEEV